MVVDPLAPNIIDLHRERILTEIGRLRDSNDQRPTPEQLEKLYNKAAFISNKSNVLARAISQEASKYFIPVDPEAIEVVSAVKRKSADSDDGLRISFDLFKDAVKASQQTKKEMEETIILSQSITTGSVLQKRLRKIRARVSIMTQSGVAPGDNVLEMLVSQFLTLWIAHTLMKPFENLEDHTTITAVLKEKQEGAATEMILIQILIGLIVQFIIMGLNDDAMESALNEAAGSSFPGGHSAASLINIARQSQRLKIHQYAEMQAGIDDYETILRYSFDFFKLTIEPGYDMWTSYVDVVQMRNITQSIWVQAPHYSVSHAIVTQNFSSLPNKKNKGSVTTSDNSLVSNQFQQYMANSLLRMANSSYAARNNALDSINDNLDLVAQVLSSDFAIQVACCLGRFLGKLDPNVLKALRAMLEGLLRAYRFDMANVLNAMLDMLTGINFSEIIAMLAMKEIDKIFDKLIDKVLGLFGDDIRALLCCPLIGEIIQKVLEGIIRLESELKGAVSIFLGKLLESLGVGSINIKFRFEQKYEQRVLYKMIMILEAVIKAIDAFDSCGKDGQFTQPSAATRHSIQLPTIKIDDNEKTNYFASALPKELSNGKFLPALGNEIESLVVSKSSDAAGNVADRHTCGGSFNEEILSKAAAAFIKGN